MTWLVMAGSVEVLSAQSRSPGPEVHVPDVQGVFDHQSQHSAYRSVIHLAELPAVHVVSSVSQPLPTSDSGNLSSPVALVSYEDEESVVAHAASSVSAGLGWFADPLFGFGRSVWSPIDEQSVDQWKLEQLESTLAELNQQLEARDDPEEVLRKALTLAEGWIKQARDDLAGIKELRSKIKSAPAGLEQLQASMNQPLPEPPGELDDELSLAEHEGILQDQREREQKLRIDYRAAEAQIDKRAEKFAGFARKEEQLKEQLNEALREVETQSPSDLTGRIALMENQCKAFATQIKLRLIEVERQWLVATEKTSFLWRDWVKRQLDHATASTQKLANLLAARRDQLIREEAEKARQEATEAHPLVRDLAEENARLAEELASISGKIREHTEEQSRLDQQLAGIRNIRQKLDEHVSAAGHSRAVGMMLRYERNNLPKTASNRERLQQIEVTLPDLLLKRLKIREMTKKSAEIQSEIEATIESLAPQSRISSEELTSKANQLLTKQRDYLYELNSEYEKFVDGLARLQTTHEKVMRETTELRNYIDEHVLWIRSAEPLDSTDFQNSVQALQSIGNSPQWQSIVRGVQSRLATRWPFLGMIAIGLLLAFGLRHQLDRRLRSVCRRRSEFRILPLLRSFLLTLVQATFLPALVATVGWLLASPWEPGSLRDSLSQGLLAIAPQLLVAQIVYRLTIRGGVAETQFGWAAEVCDVVRHATVQIARLGLPLIALTYALEVYADGQWINSLGRIVFIAAMLVLTLASFHLIRGIAKAWKSDPQSASSIWETTRLLWAPLVIGGPLALACVSALGYMYSSVFLGVRLLMTWWLILGTVVGFSLLRRLIDIGHNIIVARRRWRLEREARDHGDTSHLTADQDINAIRLQVTRLLHVTSVVVCVVVAFIFWREALPAVQAFDYGLFQVQRQVESIGPNQETIAVNELTWITVADVLQFLALLVGTFILSRNFPGLLQMVLLDRLPIDRGGKYAISIVCRYVVAAVGLVLACRMIGLTWTSVQWLVAAMSVGLGFGLQEIFANFVSGIIILLERPIRVGDLVTVNETTGFVTKIKLRATMIMDYDRRELIVPNKKFITDDVINWTLSDAVTRVVVPVGVAYGSDTERTQASLLKVAAEHPLVLADPRPEVVFAKFGDSSLSFELRVYIPNRDHYPEIVHELHMAIDREFRQQQIEIAFPQQDIHIKGLDPSMLKLTRSPRKKAG